jgi:hypothetical protein
MELAALADFNAVALDGFGPAARKLNAPTPWRLEEMGAETRK